MSIYDRVGAALDGWLRDNGFTFYAERALLDRAPAARRMCVAHVISDPDARHANNRPRVRYHRVQIDILVDETEQAGLYGWFKSAEAALMGTGALPQGNYRMEYDDDSRIAWIHKDYIFKEVLTDGSVR